ncbi:GDSL-type esterase/lipase family protein [Lactobacillus xylocopicola]|uniref:Esterase n=1 Tax=Lactobacillus xylocopicola TaxID=2976676 RepID=A0ABN6SKT9_9LACO|nr:GDSL-type esterase/lipase family protein [Lactobacillus xylocopicola]BDR60273.1 esterase [Lactobacillus xylocopicola]
MKLLLTGDSIIARKEGLQEPHINNDIKKKIPQVEVVNTAISGINSGAFLAMLADLILKKPRGDKLAILLGTNDLALHKQVPPERFKQNIELLVASVICQYYPPNVVLISPPAVDERKQKKRNNKLVERYAGIINEVAHVYQVKFVNLYQAMINAGDLSNLCRGELDDGLHFGAAGYDLLANLLVEQLTR